MTHDRTLTIRVLLFIIIRENIDIMKSLLLTKAAFFKYKYSKNSNIVKYYNIFKIAAFYANVL